MKCEFFAGDGGQDYCGEFFRSHGAEDFLRGKL